ncbi:MAG: hypothetical protein VW397_01395, partial [Candidatus Margulisiibacteriota bacterium]
DYIDHRLILINLFLKSLTYPFFLFLFTIILFFIVSEMVPSLFLTTPSYQGFTYLIFFGVFMGVAILLLFAFNAVRFGVFDLLVLIQLSLSQGMSLDVICSSLLFTGRIQKQWARLSFLIVHERSFVDGFVQLFSLPIVVEEILRMHQVSGRLLSGLNVVLPIHKSLIMNRVARLGYIFKGLIYCCIVVFILIIMSTLYQPMTNLNM